MDGVGSDGVGVVEADVSPPQLGGGAVLVEVAAGQVDRADAIERDRDRVVRGPVARMQHEDSREGAVADVGAGLSRWVEVAVGSYRASPAGLRRVSAPTPSLGRRPAEP